MRRSVSRTWPPREGYGLELARWVGNGPFVLAAWTHGERMVFERNERFHDPVRLARWTKVAIGDPAAARAAYERGDLDAVAVTPTDNADRNTLLGRHDLHRVLDGCIDYVALNAARPPFDDPLVRLAFAKALDRGDYVRSMLRTAVTATTLIPTGLVGHPAGDVVQAFDPAEARRLLAASRYGPPTNGSLGRRLAAIFRGEAQQAPLRWAADQWKANLGLDIAVEEAPWSGVVAPKPSDLPAFAVRRWCQDFPDPAASFNVLDTVTTWFRDERLADIVAQARVETDTSRREALHEDAGRALSRSAPFVWLASSERWWLSDRRSAATRCRATTVTSRSCRSRR